MLKPLVYPLLLLCLFSSTFYQTLAACPIGQTPSTEEGATHCIPQAIITPRIRPTPSNFVYILTFEGGKVPFTSIADFNHNTMIKFASSITTLSNAPERFTSEAIAPDLSVIQIKLGVSEIAFGITMTVSFTDFAYSESRVSNIDGSVKLALEPTKELTDANASLIESLIDVDFLLEIVWVVLSLFNPYWIMYMEGKFYRETLNALKYTSVNYEPFLTTFYRLNDKKVSGFRLPNLLGMFLLGNNFQSEWAKSPQDSIRYGEINPNRIEDLKILAGPEVLRFSPFVLFIDNFGAEITVMVLIILFIAVLNIMYKLMDLEDNEKPWVEALRKVREVLTNFLLMNALGCCQSLFFFAGVQIYGLFYEKSLNNMISLGIAVIIPLVLVPVTIVFVTKSARKRIDDWFFERVITQTKALQPQRVHIKFLGPVLSFYRTGDMRHPITLLYILARAMIFAVVLLTLQSSPIAQTAIMLGTSAIYLTSIIILKPFWRPLYRAFKMIYEAILFLNLTLLMVMSVRDNGNAFVVEERSGFGYTFIALWMAVPLVTIIFAGAGIIHYIRQVISRREKLRNGTVKIAPEIITDGKVLRKRRAEKEETEKEKKKKKNKQYVYPDKKKPLIDLVKFKDPNSSYEPVASLGAINSMPEIKDGAPVTAPSESELQVGSLGFLDGDAKAKKAGMSIIMDVEPEEEYSPELGKNKRKKFNRPRQQTLPLETEGQEGQRSTKRLKGRHQTEIVLDQDSSTVTRSHIVANSMGGLKFAPDSVIDIPSMHSERLEKKINRQPTVRMTPRSLQCVDELEVQEEP